MDRKGCVVVFQRAPLDEGYGVSFHVLVVHLHICFGDCLFKNFACFLMKLFVFILWCGTSPLYTLSTEACRTHVSQSVGCWFTLWGGVTGRPELSVSVKPNSRSCSAVCVRFQELRLNLRSQRCTPLWRPSFRCSCRGRVPALFCTSKKLLKKKKL